MSDTIRVLEQVNLNKMIDLLQKICLECDHYQTDSCKPSTCMVGFSLRSLHFANKKGILDIPGAVKHIPGSDLKYYFAENIIPVLAETCRQCRECRDNHSPDCVIALTRSCLESTVLEENIPYPGSVFLYLTMVKKQNPRISVMLAEELV